MRLIIANMFNYVLGKVSDAVSVAIEVICFEFRIETKIVNTLEHSISLSIELNYAKLSKTFTLNFESRLRERLTVF